MKRFIVVVPQDDGGVSVYPMKQWLRQHPEHVPPGLDPTSSTSHQLRNALKKRGWQWNETPSEERLILPSSSGGSSLVDEVLGDPEERSEQDEPAGVAFSLEYQLRDFIAQNLSALKIGESQLRLYVDPTGRDGVEYPTAVGPIDILAIDESGAFVVFELKRASSPDHAIGQVARYMGWVKHTIGREGRVRGVIVGRTITEKLKYAASIIPDVELFEYEVQFHFRAANAVSHAGSR